MGSFRWATLRAIRSLRTILSKKTIFSLYSNFCSRLNHDDQFIIHAMVD